MKVEDQIKYLEAKLDESVRKRISNEIGYRMATFAVMADYSEDANAAQTAAHKNREIIELEIQKIRELLEDYKSGKFKI